MNWFLSKIKHGSRESAQGFNAFLSSAQQLITDALGRQLKTMQLSTSGVINVDVTSLASDVYHYSLIVDNKTVATKKMTVVN